MRDVPLQAFVGNEGVGGVGWGQVVEYDARGGGTVGRVVDVHLGVREATVGGLAGRAGGAHHLGEARRQGRRFQSPAVEVHDPSGWGRGH